MNDLLEIKDIKCNTCKHLDVNYASDEAYCLAAEGEEIFLRSGQKRPKWCPLKKIEKEET